MNKNDFSRITLVSVTGLPDARGAVRALALSQRQMPGARALLCSVEMPPDLPEGIEHQRIAPLGYYEYSWFIMFALWHVVKTDYALIVQEDGWVLDGNNWRDEFFDYDYLGAPVSHGRVDTPDGTRWVTKFAWNEHLNRPGHTVFPVLNGGFSLRSRRMLRALIDHPKIKLDIARPDMLHTNPLRMGWRNHAPNEDVQLTAILRPQLEAVGIRYAPLEVCSRFSVEDTGPMYRDADLMRLFGHHGSWRRLVSIDPPTVKYRFNRSFVARARREKDIVSMLEARGYTVEVEPEA